MRPTRRQLLAALAALPVSAVLPRLAWAASPKDVATWAGAIEAFEAQDNASPPEPGRVLFIGSSSIRKWSSLADDMKPLPVINRGFGGSHLPHVTHYAPRIVAPYKPRAIVLYAGENDIAWGASAEDVLGELDRFVAWVREHVGGVPIWFLSVKPSPLRWDTWPEMDRANALIRARLQEVPGVTYVDVASVLLDAQGLPDPSLFVSDKLHLNAAGYTRWTAVVRDALKPLFDRMNAEKSPAP